MVAFLADYLELDLSAVTKILKEQGVGPKGTDEYAWMGKTLKELEEDAEKSIDVDNIDCYHGDFRRHKH